MRNSLLTTTALFVILSAACSQGGGGVTGVVTTNRPAVTVVSLFFGPPANDEAGRKVREITGVSPYKPGQAQDIEQVRERAIAAIKQEGRPIDEGYDCAANIAMTTGECTLLLNKVGAPNYSVTFDSSGQITHVGGASGPHGEGGWGREYTHGQHDGPANRSQPVQPGTNRPSAAAGSGR